jgi:hypothetical protein
MENKNEATEEVSVIPVSADVIFQQDRALIDTQVATAKQYPRNMSRATENAIFIVTLDKETAATCTYSVPRGGKAITGPSVHMAKILAQQWGNMRVEAKVVNIDEKQITSQAICFDLETNLAIKVEVKRSIIGNRGRFNDDMITVTGNAANSIAMRNAILAVIPRSVVDKVYKAAQSTIIGDISDETKLIARRKQLVDQLKDTYNVTEVEILGAVGKAAVTHLTAEDLVTLIGVGTAIKDGDTDVDRAFRGKKDGKVETITPEELQALLDSKVLHINQKELDDANRIIKKKEVASYKKLKEMLDSKKE